MCFNYMFRHVAAIIKYIESSQISLITLYLPHLPTNWDCEEVCRLCNLLILSKGHVVL
jgi:hypothetical protein